MKDPIAILLVEDNPADARLLKKLLAQVKKVNFEWVEAETLEGAIAVVAKQKFDVILLDLLLPDSQGSETLKQMHKAASTVPIVVLTGLDDEDLAVEALREGAQDYLVKGEIQRSWLARAIHHAIERQRILDRLQQLNEELVRSNQELEEFAYIASHDLQQPLTAISAITQLLTMKYQDSLDARADQYIARIGEGVGRMQQLIRGLLTYARVGPGEQEFALTDCDRALEQALANLQAAIDESGAVITVGQLPTVIADEMQLTQLLQNLIGNSIKYCRPGVVPQIQISAQASEQEWLFSIRDNGIGIETEHFGRIFQIFQRLHSDDEYAGTGIGLSICKRIVESHQGRIWLESQVGVGTIFYFTLPRELANSSKKDADNGVIGRR
jgi:two-component system, sensor histidine kinase and response regulator